jgi:hypothetical protein
MHYTQDEWLLLGKAPVQVGMAVMGAGETSPFQLVRELIGMGQALRETGQASGATALIRELNVETQAQLSEMAQQQKTSIDFTQIRTQTPEMCQKVAAIVDAKESATAAEEYKRWLLWIGRRVAAAAREDTSEPVTADEIALLGAIAAALGVENGHGAADRAAKEMSAAAEAIPSAAPAGAGISIEADSQKARDVARAETNEEPQPRGRSVGAKPEQEVHNDHGTT